MTELAYRNKAWTSTNLVSSGEDEHHARVTQMLDQIYSIHPIGENFLKELDAAHKVTIIEGRSFSCRANGDDQFPLFLKYLRARDFPKAGDELEWAIDHSPFKKNPYALCHQLAHAPTVLMTHAFTPKQLSKYKTAKRRTLLGFGHHRARVFTPTMGYGVTLQVVETMPQAEEAARIWSRFLIDFWNGDDEACRTMAGNDRVRVALVSCLHQYFRKGVGIPVTVTTSDSTDTACSLDLKRVERPFAVALAHELVHAYYAVTGTRPFPEGTEEDEAVTTGLPPFHYQKYSENLLRANWHKGAEGLRVGLRLFYSFGNVYCSNCGKKNAYTYGVRVKGKWKDMPRLNCERCGEALPNPALVQDLPDIDL